MKICFVVDSMFTLGGIQRCVTNLANYLINKNYDVSIIIANDEKINLSLYGLDLRVNIIFLKKIFLFRKILVSWKIILKQLNKKFNLFSRNKRILEFIYYNYHKKNLFKIFDNKEYSTIISTGSYFNVLLSLYSNDKCRKIGWQHSSYESYFGNNIFKNRISIMENMFNNLDEYVVLVEIDREKILTNHGFDTKVISNFISFEQPIKSRLLNNRFISVGRYSKEKAFDDLILNFKEFNKVNKNWSLYIYGTGEEKKYLNKLIKDLNLTDFVYLIDGTNKISEEYLKASIYCMTSKIEGFPMVLLEAMESGLPVIAYELPCLVELLNNDDSILIKSRDGKEYVKQMIILANNYDLRKKIANNGFKTIERYTISNLGKEWESLINYNKNCNK